ncbi:MAG: EAL domain-containing protein, partial [Pseudomonadota bacterium]
GIELHIDDYGTSHSSISSLLLIRPKRIKIDRQFCARVAQSKEARDIVRLTVALAKSLGISVTAEGVEDFETAERLAGLGCDMLQGYLFGKPCPATAFPTLLHGLSGEKIA